MKSLIVFSLTLLLYLTAGCGPVTTKTATTPIISPVGFAAGTLPTAVLGEAYSAHVTAHDGVAPYAFSLAGGGLPPGISLSSAGLLTGTPTAPGSFTFSITVADASTPQEQDTRQFTLASAPRLTFLLSQPVTVPQLVPYSAALVGGGVQPYVVTLTSGSLPKGLNVSTAGVLAGTPGTAGSFQSEISVADASGQTATATLQFTVGAPALSVAAVPPIVLAVGSPIQQPLQVTGGVAPYSFSVAQGSLPPGASLSPAGAITGALTSGGVYAATIQVQDSQAQPLTTSVVVNVAVTTATVTVDPTTVLATLPSTAYGIHTAVYDPDLANVSALGPLLATAGVAVLRYPGGSYADRYHWAQNTLTPIFASTPPACHLVSIGTLATGTDFGSFAKLLQSTGQQALITVNYGTSVADAKATRSSSNHTTSSCSEPNTAGQPEEAAAWVAYANGSPADTQVIGKDQTGYDWKTVGFWASLRGSTPLAADDGFNFLRIGAENPIGVHYWEIGNEIYYNGWNNNINTETDLHAPYVYPTGYGTAFQIRTGVSQLSPTTYGSGAARYISAMKAVDPSIQIGVIVGDAIDPIGKTWTPSVLQAVCSQVSFDFAVLHYYPGTYNAVTGQQLLADPQVDMPTLTAGIRSAMQAACPANGAGIPIFITETNPNGRLAPDTPPVVPALFASQQILSAFESGVRNVDWLELHGGAGTFLTPGTNAPGPAFFGVELAHLAAGPGDKLIAARSSRSTLLAHAAAQSGGDHAVLVINADPTNAATVEISDPQAQAGVTAMQYSYGTNTTESTPALAGVPLPLPGTAVVIQVAPYTATVLAFPTHP